MKSKVRIIVSLFLISSLSVIILNSCTRCTRTTRYMANVPTYDHLNSIRAIAEVRGPQTLTEPRKIVTFNQYLLINEGNEGFHIIDNSNPANPVFKSFVFLGISNDIYVVDGFIYADRGPDLTVWDMSDPSNPTLKNTIHNVVNVSLIKGDSFPIRWEVKEIVEVDEDANCGSGRGIVFGVAEDGFSAGSSSAQNGTQAGSMSRITFVGDFLYVVDDNTLNAIDITNPSSPIVNSKTLISSGTETIFPYKEFLFLGNQFGMDIFNIGDNPRFPQFLSQFSHLRGCDPVVVKDDLAYVTLRSGRTCGPAEDALHVVSVKNITQPQLLMSYPMSEPNGLGISDSLLMICDGIAGLKTFDHRETFSISTNLYSTLSNMTTYDVILRENHAIISAKEGIFQYNFEDPSSPIELSTLFSK